jgi:hypothetical protein
MKVKRCVVCQKDMPDFWQKLDGETVKNLARQLGIRPVCAECFKETLFRLYGGKSKSAENKA